VMALFEKGYYSSYCLVLLDIKYIKTTIRGTHLK